MKNQPRNPNASNPSSTPVEENLASRNTDPTGASASSLRNLFLGEILKESFRDETATETALSDQDLLSWLSGKLTGEEKERVRRGLWGTEENRRRLALLAEVREAMEEQGPSLPERLFEKAWAIGAKESQPTEKKSIYESIRLWLVGDGKWAASTALAAACVLVFVLFFQKAESEFPEWAPPVSGHAFLDHLAPTEFETTAFSEASPRADLAPARLGYLAALARDAQAAGKTENLAPQADLLRSLDPTLANDLIEKAQAGQNPCSDLEASLRERCHAGAWLYVVMRDGDKADSKAFQELRKQFPEAMNEPSAKGRTEMEAWQAFVMTALW